MNLCLSDYKTHILIRHAVILLLPFIILSYLTKFWRTVWLVRKIQSKKHFRLILLFQMEILYDFSQCTLQNLNRCLNKMSWLKFALRMLRSLMGLVEEETIDWSFKPRNFFFIIKIWLKKEIAWIDLEEDFTPSF